MYNTILNIPYVVRDNCNSTIYISENLANEGHWNSLNSLIKILDLRFFLKFEIVYIKYMCREPLKFASYNMML